jgi:hypothetical protein
MEEQDTPTVKGFIKRLKETEEQKQENEFKIILLGTLSHNQ